MGETAVNAAQTTEKAAKADHTDKAKKAKKAKKEKKPSFFKGLKKEFKKIVFPDRHTVTKQTIAVVLASIFLGALIAILDLVIKFGLGFIL